VKVRSVVLAVAFGAAALLVVAPPTPAHTGASFCHSSFSMAGVGPVRSSDGTRAGHGEGECSTSFQGFPIGVIGRYDAGDPTAPASIHVEALAVLPGNRVVRLAECEAAAASGGVAACEMEFDELPEPLTLPEPLPAAILEIRCVAHSHARVKVDTQPLAEFGCYTTEESEGELRSDMGVPADDAGGGDGGDSDDGGGDGGPEGPAASQVVTAVPQDTYLPKVVLATRAGSLTFLNADLNRHDVVARVYDGATLRADHTRPDGSAPWCEDFSGDCPLFWSELIEGPGQATEVLGLEGAVVGTSYEFYCSIHPNMRGTLQVVG
jgi:plastocyanin